MCPIRVLAVISFHSSSSSPSVSTAHSGYGSVPRMARQRMRFSASSGARSTWLEVHLRRGQRVGPQLRIANRVRLGVHLVQRHVAGQASKGVKSGVSVKQSRIGRRCASNWFIGGRPRICSIVRSRLIVLYCVLTTAPRRA